MEKNWERSAKVFGDRLMFGDGPVYPIGFKINEGGVERGVR
jgi:hypothetical protein